jgi:hypothetical protein
MLRESPNGKEMMGRSIETIARPKWDLHKNQEKNNTKRRRLSNGKNTGPV